MDECGDIGADRDDLGVEFDAERLTWELALRAWLSVAVDELTTSGAS